MPDFFWSVDALVVRDNAVFGFGWIFHIDQEIMELRLRINIAGKNSISPTYLVADIGKVREDVEFQFLDQLKARHSGYVFYGAFPVGREISSVDILCLLQNKSTLEIPVPNENLTRFSYDRKVSSSYLFFRQLYIFSKRGMGLIRAGKYNSLWSKVNRYIGGRKNGVLHEPGDLKELLLTSESINLTVIVDHDLGGGANDYRERMVDSIICQKGSVIILTFHVPTLSHILVVTNSRINYRFAIPDKEFFLRAIGYLDVSDIVYNTGVSFLRPEETSPLLIQLKQITSARLKVLIHDYFVVCPSHFLINDEGKYCEIPDIDVCNRCLSRNQQGFSTLFSAQDMSKWRAIWGSLLNTCDEIVTFSNSSLNILRSAYPEIDPLKISVIPHDIRHLKGKSPRILSTSHLQIGVVGQIGFHKGSNFIQRLAIEIKRRKMDCKIVVIGTIEANCDSTIVTETGAYEHSELPDLVEQSGVNVMLFPSIWPETFSYVVHELLGMNLPIASFNLGAPSDRLSSYPNGLVLDSTDPKDVLNELISFHRKLYLS